MIDVIRDVEDTFCEINPVLLAAQNVDTIFSDWCGLAKKHYSDTCGRDFNANFACTLVMGSHTAAVKPGYEIEGMEITAYFFHWAYRHLSTFEKPDFVKKYLTRPAMTPLPGVGKNRRSILSIREKYAGFAVSSCLTRSDGSCIEAIRWEINLLDQRSEGSVCGRL